MQTEEEPGAGVQERQLQQGDLPVHPDRPLQAPADGVTIFPSDFSEDNRTITGELESEPEPDPVRDSVIVDDWGPPNAGFLNNRD